MLALFGWWFVFDGVCVHCAVHGQHGLDGPLWGFVGWVVKWIYCFTDWWVSSLGVLLILVVLVVLARGLHPVSFPNLEVKPFCADGTATGGLWESRALPTVSLSVVGVFGPCLGGRHPHHHFCLWCVFGGWGHPPFCV